MCPKQISELKTAQRNVQKVGGKKIEFAAVIQKIVESNQYWSVSEVHKQLCEGKIGRFRTMKLLNAQCIKGGKIERLYQDGRFYYGPVTQPVTEVVKQ
jgi:hypothetical protein